MFEPPDDATPQELRARLRALADLVDRAPVPIAVAHDEDQRRAFMAGLDQHVTKPAEPGVLEELIAAAANCGEQRL